MSWMISIISFLNNGYIAVNIKRTHLSTSQSYLVNSHWCEHLQYPIDLKIVVNVFIHVVLRWSMTLVKAALLLLACNTDISITFQYTTYMATIVTFFKQWYSQIIMLPLESVKQIFRVIFKSRNCSEWRLPCGDQQSPEKLGF